MLTVRLPFFILDPLIAEAETTIFVRTCTCTKSIATLRIVKSNGKYVAMGRKKRKVVVKEEEAAPPDPVASAVEAAAAGDASNNNSTVKEASMRGDAAAGKENGNDKNKGDDGEENKKKTASNYSMTSHSGEIVHGLPSRESIHS